MTAPDVKASAKGGGDVTEVTERVIRETKHGVIVYPPSSRSPYYRLTWTTRTGERKYGTGGRDGDRAWAKAVEKDKELEDTVSPLSVRPIREMTAAFLLALQPAWEPAHYDKTKQQVDRWIDPELGNLLPWQLQRADVERVLALPPSDSGKRHLRNAMGVLLVWAHGSTTPWIAQQREHFMPKQPRTAKREKKGRAHGQDVQFIAPSMRPSAEACRQLAAAMCAGASSIDGKPSRRRRRRDGRDEGEMLWLLVAVAASCGLRQGELFGLTVGQLLFASNELFIDRQLTRTMSGGVNLAAPPKWGRVRTTILPEDTIWGEPLRERLEAYVAGRAATDLVFTTTTGKPLHPSNFGARRLKQARCDAEAWDERWVFHSLRHAFCSWLLSSNPATGKEAAQDVDVALLAGHRDSGVTRKMYVGGTVGTTGRVNALFRARGVSG